MNMNDLKKIHVCPDCGDTLQFGSGCYHCPSCGYGKCGRAIVQNIGCFGLVLICLAAMVLS